MYDLPKAHALRLLRPGMRPEQAHIVLIVKQQSVCIFVYHQ